MDEGCPGVSGPGLDEIERTSEPGLGTAGGGGGYDPLVVDLGTDGKGPSKEPMSRIENTFDRLRPTAHPTQMSHIVQRSMGDHCHSARPSFDINIL